ncbi:hypothetical protein RB600_006200 [Gaeumannomyces tritici]
MPQVNKTVVLVTGANKGIGRAIAAQLAKEHDYYIILGCRNPLAAEDLATELSSAGHSAETLQLDLDSDKSIEAAVAAIHTRHRPLDVLINNAACLTEALFPLLRASADGPCSPPRVVFVPSHLGSSTIGVDPSSMFYHANMQAYTASKAAMNRMALVYARILSDVGAVSTSPRRVLSTPSLQTLTPTA